MDLHLHLSVAFRALDRKWGIPVDLDTSGDVVPCLPAEVERPNTTFSSEDFLKTIKRNRPKPYSRTEDRRRGKKNVKLNDSFSNISVSRMSMKKDQDNIEKDENKLDNSVCGRILGAVDGHLSDEKFAKPKSASSTVSINSCSKRKEEFNSILKEFKLTTLMYVGNKLRRKAAH